MLKPNRQVYRVRDGLLGTVLPAGPYGDEPFQVRDEHGNYHSGVNEDGAETHSRDRWALEDALAEKRRELAELEALRAKYPFAE